MRNAGTYDELSELEELANQYREAGMEDARATTASTSRISCARKVEQLDLAVELGITGTIDEKADVRGPTRPARRSRKEMSRATRSISTNWSNGSTST